MGGSRFLNPTTPGGLLSPVKTTNIDPDEELVLQAITDGSYFVTNETPTGLINSSNTVFTLAFTPNPANSLILVLNGVIQKAGGVDYTLSGDTITFVTAPETDMILTAALYLVSPV